MVAYKPGKYTFFVVCRGSLGPSAGKEVSLDIHQNKVTTVNISFELMRAWSRFSDYRMNIVIESPE